MKREDYERMGAPLNVPLMRAEKFIHGHISDIVAVSQGQGPSPPTHLGVMVEVNDLPTKALVALDKETADEVIRALIAGRNHLWPTP